MRERMSSELPAEISQYIRRALEEDIGTGDVTTDTIVPANASLRGRIVAKQDGVVAGLNVAKQVMLALNESVEFRANVEDGSKVTRGRSWPRSKVQHARFSPANVRL